MALAVAALLEREVGAHHPHAAGGRGRRAARLPARRPARQGRPVPAPAVRRALRHARRRPADRVHGEGHDRGRAARVHARPHAERLLHHPRRGAEHEPRADADVPDAARLRLEGGRHRRRHADRPAARPGLGAASQCRDILGVDRGIAFVRSRTPTSSATSWCSGSSRPTGSTPRRRAPSAARERRCSRSRSTTAAASRSTRRPPPSWPVASSRRRASTTASSASPSSARTRAARSSASTSASTRRPTCSRSRSTAATTCRTGLPRQLGDVVLCPQVVGDDWRASARARPAAPARLRPRARDGAARTGAGDVSTAAGCPAPRAAATQPGRERRRRRCCPAPARAAAHPARRELQLRVRGDHPRPPHAAEHAHPLRGGGGRPGRRRSGSASTGSSCSSLLLAIAFVLDRRDGQHGDRGGDRRRHQLVRPAARSWRRTSPPAPC